MHILLATSLLPVAAIRGGGMWTAGGGVVTLSSSSINSNTAQSLGGGLLATGATKVGGKPFLVWFGLLSQSGPYRLVLYSSGLSGDYLHTSWPSY
jgi:hypothetical protein